jgi:hypothetical protein
MKMAHTPPRLHAATIEACPYQGQGWSPRAVVLLLTATAAAAAKGAGLATELTAAAAFSADLQLTRVVVMMPINAPSAPRATM